MSEVRRRYIALVPARGGSTGIPLKPLALLAGRPLLDYTVEAAREARTIEAVFVTTEDHRIAVRAREVGAEVIQRPRRLAEERVAMAPVLLHALQALEARADDEEMGKVEGEVWMVLLQPTSPLRTGADIDRAVRALEEGGAEGLVSVTKVDREAYKLMAVDEDGFLRGMVSPEAPFMRRQDCPVVVRPNGAIYIYRARTFAEKGGFHFDGVLPWMMPDDRSVDIDTPEDLERAREALEA
jgi:N-acylneuraminate cytidylyltransferase